MASSWEPIFIVHGAYCKEYITKCLKQMRTNELYLNDLRLLSTAFAAATLLGSRVTTCSRHRNKLPGYAEYKLTRRGAHKASTNAPGATSVD